MPTFRYHLGDAKTPVVEIDWNNQWKDMPVRARGETVGIIANREELREGRRFDLATGETLVIHLPRGTYYLPEATLDGQPLYLPNQSPQARLGRAVMVLFLIAGVQLFVALRPLFQGVALAELPPANWVSVSIGVTFLALAALVRLQSLTAAITAFVLLVLATVWGVCIMILRIPEVGFPILNIVGLLIQLGMLASVYQGIGAIRSLRRNP